MVSRTNGNASFDKLRMRKNCVCHICPRRRWQTQLLLILSLSKDATPLVQRAEGLGEREEPEDRWTWD